MDKAIILNAGEGKRLRPLTKNLPKCLLKIGNKTILEHQLSNLARCSIKKVTVVIGHRSEMICRKIRQAPFDLSVNYIWNEIYYKTNTAYSLWLARNEMDEDFIYLNGDVLFHQEALRRLIQSKFDTCLAISKKKVGKEEMKVRIANCIIRRIGKEMEPSLADGEFIGIARFSKEFNVLLKKKLEDVIKEGKLNAFFEHAVQRTLRTHSIYAVDVSDIPCIEIDNHGDFDEAKRMYLKIEES